MARYDDSSLDMNKWTNRKLMHLIGELVETAVNNGDPTLAENARKLVSIVEKRFVRSSSRG